MVTLKSGIVLYQNDDGPLKWANGPYPIHIHADDKYHMTNTLKSHFWRKNVILLSLCTQRCYGRHNVSRQSINH